MNSGVGELYVGDQLSCLQWAGLRVGYIINCGDVNYQWHPFCVRFWWNLGHDGAETWEVRMVTAVKLVLAALMLGENVLLHCQQGKHHSGALCVLMSALLLGSSIEAAVDIYMSKYTAMIGKSWKSSCVRRG